MKGEIVGKVQSPSEPEREFVGGYHFPPDEPLEIPIEERLRRLEIAVAKLADVLARGQRAAAAGPVLTLLVGESLSPRQ